jgi:hypothetical protein
MERKLKRVEEKCEAVFHPQAAEQAGRGWTAKASGAKTLLKRRFVAGGRGCLYEFSGCLGDMPRRSDAMSRFKSIVLCALLLTAALPAPSAFAQRGDSGGDDADKAAKDEAAKKKRDSEWGNAQAPLPQLRNAGPCPFVKVLYDAGRYAEFKDDREAASAVAYTGEIQGVSSICTYKAADPIKVEVEMLFALGRGPQATSSNKTYRYWVAVTQRNQAVLAKEYFDLPVSFDGGQDRKLVTERLKGIVIPRANVKVSGSNFEILVGFDVTEKMAAFNRDGKRFRVNVQASTAPATTPTP